MFCQQPNEDRYKYYCRPFVASDKYAFHLSQDPSSSLRRGFLGDSYEHHAPFYLLVPFSLVFPSFPLSISVSLTVTWIGFGRLRHPTELDPVRHTRRRTRNHMERLVYAPAINQLSRSWCWFPRWCTNTKSRHVSSSTRTLQTFALNWYFMALDVYLWRN